jgi:sugar phosphate isomerase/epimerase
MSVPAENTSLAAKEVAERNDKVIAAICSEECAAEQGLKELTACLQDCADNGVALAILHTYIGFDKTPEITQTGLDNYGKLVSLAQKLGVKIAFENTEGEECLAALLNEFAGCDAVGFCWDSGHDNLVRSGAPDSEEQTACREAAKVGLDRERNDRVLEQMLPHVATCHVHDNDGARDRHWLPGDPRGTVDWARAVPVLLSAPRLRQIQCEAVPKFENPFTPAQSVGALRKTFA